MSNNAVEIRVRCGICKQQLPIREMVEKDGKYYERVLDEQGFITVYPCPVCTEHYHNVMGGVVDLVDRYRETVKLVQEEEGADE